jgi:hypothetical protein
MANRPPEPNIEPRPRKDAIGLWSIVFFVVSAASPLAAMLGTVPIVLKVGNGIGAPGAWVLTGIVLRMNFFMKFSANRQKHLPDTALEARIVRAQQH